MAKKVTRATLTKTFESFSDPKRVAEIKQEFFIESIEGGMMLAFDIYDSATAFIKNELMIIEVLDAKLISDDEYERLTRVNCQLHQIAIDKLREGVIENG